MPERKKSILNIFGWGLLGDVFLFITALAITAIFAVSSFSVAYVIAFAILILLLSALFFYKRTKKENN